MNDGRRQRKHPSRARGVIALTLTLAVIGAVGVFGLLDNRRQADLVTDISGLASRSWLDSMVDSASSWLMPTPASEHFKERFERDYLEANILRQINDYRVDNGRTALQVDDRLATVALSHSRYMAENDDYSHINLRGEDPTARARSAGFYCYNPQSIGVAENIHVLYGHTSSLRTISGTTYEWETQETMARRFAADFAASPEHRRNILDPRYGRTGVGVAFGPYDGIDYAIFVTHNFC